MLVANKSVVSQEKGGCKKELRGAPLILNVLETRQQGKGTFGLLEVVGVLRSLQIEKKVWGWGSAGADWCDNGQATHHIWAPKGQNPTSAKTRDLSFMEPGRDVPKMRVHDD